MVMTKKFNLAMLRMWLLTSFVISVIYSISGIKSGWKKFRELLLLLKSQVKCEKSYAAFVKSVMLYDNDT